ncbi:TonB-dependent receptor [Bradyrhizobium frederickii]|uniref:TonB-dependent receptor n=1 Tax=Bradyrhizobium frederickii TaxID=2560054 RepID=A0A4Y9L664_9BRAD|nr:TonB-dependent receptor [Bradyrhizobium frederickii]
MRRLAAVITIRREAVELTRIDPGILASGEDRLESTVSPLAVFVGDSYYDPQNTQRVPAYVRADLGASYTFANMWSGKPIVIRGRIVNLFGANYLTNVPGAGGGTSIGAPRAYMVSTTFNF